ncbi:MAG: squalene--hopene cyclase, partial [Puniceicoccales bacterium]
MAETVPTQTGPSIEGVDQAIDRIREFLFSIQEDGGYWNCELPIDSTVACDYLLYFHWAGNVDQIPQDRIAEFVKSRQNEDGGWPQFPGGPSEVNATVKGYHALKLSGESPNADIMVKAREKALELGGIPAMCTWHKLYLALVGCFPWKDCPLIPVEVMLLPKWSPLHIYRVSSWTRNMLVPLAVINHFKPTRIIEHCPDLNELYPGGTMDGDWSLPWGKKPISWKNFFLTCDKLGRIVNHLPEWMFRQRALKQAESWMCDRVSHGSDGMGAIFPAIMNVLVSLECLGYAKDHWLFEKNLQHFKDLTSDSDWWATYGKTKGNSTDGPEDWRIAPCFSPVWDTAIITMAMAESGHDPADPRLQ